MRNKVRLILSPNRISNQYIFTVFSGNLGMKVEYTCINILDIRIVA